MALHLQKIAGVRDKAPVLVVSLLSVAALLSQTSSGQQAAGNSFRQVPELTATETLLKEKHFSEARESAKRVIEQPASSFHSAKREQFVKATAYYMSGLAAEQEGDREAALAEFQQSAGLGESRSYKHLAVLLDVKSRAAPSREVASALSKEAKSCAQACAELGDVDCARTLQSAYRAQDVKDEEYYWLFVGQMLGSTSEKEKFVRYYEQNLTDADRTYLARLMRKRSLSGGEVSSSLKDVPGRSTLTASFVDALMRRDLELVWRALFSPSASDEPLDQIARDKRAAISPNSFATAYLLIPQSSGTRDRYTIPVRSAALLGANLLPGDAIIVRCGSLTHLAEFWGFDSVRRDALLLDPFYQFWQPSHNACVTSMKIVPYRYRRDLVRLSFADLRKMLEAVITIRDLAN